ncbi:MAG: hypothetical protein LBP41_02985 [Holosporaceae bacterium]|jgi:hypothetical protein|nr:hypothetical protein [Holosporaceae bacterium]
MLSKQSLDILIDLVEIKLSVIMVQDKDDVREVKRLKVCRNELIKSRKTYAKTARMSEVAFPEIAMQR